MIWLAVFLATMAIVPVILSLFASLKTCYAPTAIIRSGHPTFLILSILALNATLDGSQPTLQEVRLPRVYKLSPIVCLYDISTHLVDLLRYAWSEAVKGKRASKSNGDHVRPTSGEQDVWLWSNLGALRLLLQSLSALSLSILLISFERVRCTRSIA